MKQARRKELKTNELSAFLQQIRDAANQYSNYIMGGIVVVVLVLVVALWVQRSRHEAEAARWQEYQDLQKAAMENKTDALDQAASLAQSAAGDPVLGPMAKALYAQMVYDKAMDNSLLNPSAEQIALLERAKNAYQDIVDTYPNQPALAARARMGLAAVAETLYMVGKGDQNVAREAYQKVIDSKAAPYAEMAQQQLSTLAERASKLEIVATRPAETAASQPASAPAASAPAAAATRP